MKTFARLAAVLGLAMTAALPAAAQDKLKIGTEAAYAPFAWVLPTGELTGFDVDITKALCAQMGAECEIVNQSFDGLIPALNAKKIDAIIASMFITPERLNAIDFAGPYYSVPGIFIAAKDSGFELTADSLDGKYVGVQRGTTMADYVEANFPDARVQLYDTLEAANLDLASGRVDLVFAELGGGQQFPEVAGRRGLRTGRRAGLRRGDPRHRRWDRPAKGRHRVEGKVRRRAGGDHRVG